MSTLSKDGGSYVVQFKDRYGKRQTVRLPGVNKHAAQEVKVRIDALNGALALGVMPSPEITRWAAECQGPLADSLVRVGLIAPRKSALLGPFIDAYIAGRLDIKPGTRAVMMQARRHLVGFLGESRPVGSITAADADAFRSHLQGGDRARATVNKWCQYARQFFVVAVRHRVAAENPFAHIKGQVRGNAERRVIVPKADAERVIAVAPDPQWKLLIALARYAGLRMMSEVVNLRWRDVNWAASRFTVHASKTEHHEGGGVRVVPIFEELWPYLEAVFHAAEDGAEFVMSRYRDPSMNLRTQLVRYVVQAGLKPWPKPWQNLRASLATELANKYPSHVCTAWLGHSEKVANEFYRQVTEDHYAKAAGIVALHGALQQAPVLSISEQHQANGQVHGNAENPLKTGLVTLCGVLGGNGATGGNGSSRIRTCDRGIMSSLL